MGAGDTFIASTIFALSKSQSLKDSITFGCKIAGFKVGVKGWDKLREGLQNSGLLKDSFVKDNFHQALLSWYKLFGAKDSCEYKNKIDKSNNGNNNKFVLSAKFKENLLNDILENNIPKHAEQIKTEENTSNLMNNKDNVFIHIDGLVWAGWIYLLILLSLWQLLHWDNVEEEENHQSIETVTLDWLAATR